MSFVFATCERKRALLFLEKIYAKDGVSVSDTKESASDLLDLIEKDIIRVGDPDFHRGQIFKATNWEDSLMESVEAAIKKIGGAYRKN